MSENKELISHILCDAVNEKAAGGPTREDGQGVGQLGATSSHTATTPAAPYPEHARNHYGTPAPTTAPETCEWTWGFDTRENRKWRRGACGWSFYGTLPFVNCKCGLPIRFKETT